MKAKPNLFSGVVWGRPVRFLRQPNLATGVCFSAGVQEINTRLWQAHTAAKSSSSARRPREGEKGSERTGEIGDDDDTGIVPRSPVTRGKRGTGLITLVTRGIVDFNFTQRSNSAAVLCCNPFPHSPSVSMPPFQFHLSVKMHPQQEPTPAHQQKRSNPVGHTRNRCTHRLGPPLQSNGPSY